MTQPEWIDEFMTRIKRFPNRYLTVHFFYRQIINFLREDELSGISPGITYYFIMGFIPFLIFAVNVVLFTTAADMDFVINLLHTYFPNRMASTLENDIQHIVNQRSDLWLWVSLFAAAYNFEHGLAILVRATDKKAYGDKKSHASILGGMASSIDFLVHIKSILCAVGLVAAIMISLGLTVFGNILIQWVGDNFTLNPIFLTTWNLLIYAIPFSVLIVYLTIFYLTAPRSYSPRLFHASVTAFIVTLLWLFATIIYRWVLMIIPSIGTSYGPLFGLFTMFVWFYYIVTIIIWGLCFMKAWTIFQQKLDSIRKELAKEDDSEANPELTS